MPRTEAWRLARRSRADSAFTGIGSKRSGGRWNSKGRAVIYASSSIALAALEILVNVEDRKVLEYYVPIPIQFDSSFVRAIERLPSNWRENPHPPSTRRIGNSWWKEEASAVLAVPSTVVPPELNYVLNPNHADFKKIEVGEPRWDFTFDARVIRKPRRRR